MDPLAVTVKEAVEISGISRASLYERIRDGDLAVIKLGHKTLIPLPALKAFLERHIVEPATPIAPAAEPPVERARGQ